MSDSYELLRPDNFVAGTIGEPGQRIFFLQAREDGEIVTLKVEKGQVQALASSLADVLEDRGLAPEPVAPVNMTEPAIAAWTVGGLGIGLDNASGRIVVMAEELVDNEGDTAASAMIHLTPGQVKGYIDHALFLVEYGRDFGRQNGHHPPGE